MFKDIIGQENTKKKLNFFLDCYKNTKVSPHLLFVAPKGCGKTMFAIQYGKEMEAMDSKKEVRLVNCSSIKNLRNLFDSIIIPHISEKDVTFIFDEASELPKDVTMALLTILNPNPQNKTTFSYLEDTFDFDFKRQTFLFCTSESHKIFHALADRLTRIDLDEYTIDNLGEVMQKVVPDVSIPKDLLNSVSQTLRSNPRQATKMGNNIKNYLGNKKNFLPTDWALVKSSLNILPYGLTEIELSVLKAIKERQQCRLTTLAAITGMTRTSIQRDIEIHLLRNDLIKIEAEGRCLTKKGADMLNSL